MSSNANNPSLRDIISMNLSASRCPGPELKITMRANGSLRPSGSHHRPSELSAC